MQRFEETGSVAAKPSGGSASPLEKHAKFLLAQIANKPDLTLDEIVVAMRKRRIAGSRSAVWRFFARRNISFKKNSVRGGAEARGRGPRPPPLDARPSMFDPARLVFIDETSTNTAMVRLRGRAPRGERLVDYAPQGAWKTVTFVGGLRQRGMTAPFVIEGAMNGPMFLAYVKQCLVPTLNRGETVLMDHLPVHKVAGVAPLVNRLETETRAGRQGRLADHLTRMDFIVLDELGYLPFAQSGGKLLFHLVSRLYERMGASSEDDPHSMAELTSDRAALRLPKL